MASRRCRRGPITVREPLGELSGKWLVAICFQSFGHSVKWVSLMSFRPKLRPRTWCMGSRLRVFPFR